MLQRFVVADENVSDALEIRTLGGLEVRRQGREISGFISRKEPALPLYLCARPGTHARELLADLFWDDRTQAQALTNLRAVLSRLKRRLASYLTITHQTVAFNSDRPYWLDVTELDRRLMRMTRDQRLSRTAIDYSIHPLPRWAAAIQNVGSDTYTYYWMVNRFSSPEKQTAAWKLAGYLTEFPARYLQEADLFQPKLDYVSSEGFQSSKQGQLMKIFLDEAMVSHPHARVPGLFELIDAFDRMIDRVVIGHETIDRVLAETEVESNLILKRAAEDARQ